MEKLKLEHLAPYLPYDLLLWYSERLSFSEFFDAKKEAHSLKMGVVSMMSCIEGNSKPILRPLSDLTKEIEVNGEKLIPVDEFYMMYGGGFATKKAFLQSGFIDGLFYSDVETYRYSTIKKLLEWHFDIFKLIENNLAIDINTL